MLRLNILDNFCWEKRELFGENCCRSPRGSVDWNIMIPSVIPGHDVAPLVGAWIEMSIFFWLALIQLVAPLVGAWIEIRMPDLIPRLWRSLPSWERGLKYRYWMCQQASHPSLPSWERGLKSEEMIDAIIEGIVAPLVGAWIEICARTEWPSLPYVAPLVGAWIEIVQSDTSLQMQ